MKRSCCFCGIKCAIMLGVQKCSMFKMFKNALSVVRAQYHTSVSECFTSGRHILFHPSPALTHLSIRLCRLPIFTIFCNYVMLKTSRGQNILRAEHPYYGQKLKQSQEKMLKRQNVCNSILRIVTVVWWR